MRASKRLELIDIIGRELQSRYTYIEIDHYLSTFEISSPTDVTTNSKWIYSKEALAHVSDETILRIADDLELDGYIKNTETGSPPKIWENNEKFRLFISHLAKNSDKAMRLKETLEIYGISCFVAHKDIEPTKEWQSEIERALGSMDAMLAVLTKGFSSSYWTQQEIGFALGARKKVLSLRMDEDPTGFISKHQAVRRKSRPAEAISEEINRILLNDNSTRKKLELIQSRMTTVDEEIPF